jgi:hypothetical protein
MLIRRIPDKIKLPEGFWMKEARQLWCGENTGYYQVW